ncbi:cytochrome P450 family protein [Streptomyces sp. 8N114]|uniref:cytochrome P450 family protein n=1 Tax=Streptomyces sp. 8N114 TaxID=3457419 RepID=UPI003FCEF65A
MTGVPIRRTVMSSGFRPWLITGHAEVRSVMADPRFAKDSHRVAELLDRHSLSGSDSVFGQSLLHHMLNTDPPEHGRLRTLVNKAFTPRAVERLRPRIGEICDELLDALEGKTHADLLAAYAVPLPVKVICELLGIPQADREMFRSWSNTLVSALPPEVVNDASAAMEEYLHGLVAAKAKEPREDMLSALVHAQDSGQRLSADELVSMACLLLAAGHETTVNLIGNGLLALLTHPDQFAALRADRTRLPGAIEEFLRYDSPVNQATLRFTTEPVRIGGVEIPEGEFVILSIDSANHDTRVYDDPDVLDIGREGGSHLAFGHGIHYCLGAPLARLEAQLAFTKLLDRYDRIDLAVPEQQLEWRFSVVMRGLERLPVRLRRRADQLGTERGAVG